MEKNIIIIGILLLAIGVGIGYLFPRSNLMTPTGTHLRSDGSRMSQNIDQYFISQMIPHHEGAIEMAKIALKRSKRPEILSLAKGVIEAQERENHDMRAWYEQWFGAAPSSSGMGMMHMDGMKGDLDILTSVPPEGFDREFIEQMIPHHEMAIMMAQMLLAATERGEMKTLANNIIVSQSSEIQMMRGWLKAWY